MPIPSREADGPSVSVIMALYNKQKFVAEAIKSGLAQDYHNFELLIIDDKSTDESLEIAKQFSSERPIRIIANSEHRGYPATENRGIQEARGELIAFLDADDISRPEKLSLQVEAMHTDGKLVDRVVYTDYFKLSESGVVKKANVLDPDEAIEGNAIGAILRRPEYIAYATMMCKRESILEVGMFDENIPVRADLDLALKLAKKRPFVGVFQPLYGYRTDSTSMMHTTSVRESYRIKLLIMDKHLKLNPEVSKTADFVEIRRQIARCLIVTRDYGSAFGRTIRNPKMLADFYYWYKRR